MIINYPTGFYDSVIAYRPGVPTDITFTISNNPPPRTQLLFTKLPPGVQMARRPPRVYTVAQRRAVVGALAFTTIASGGSQITTGMKQYEVGQILDFATGQPATIDPMLVSSSSQRRHDTNLFDYDMMGLDQGTQDTLNAQAATAYQTLLSQLNSLIQQRTDCQTQLETTQKTINEITKTLSALTSVIAISPDPVLVAVQANLSNQLSVLQAQQAALVVQANQIAAQAVTVRDQVTSVSQLVR